MSLPGNGIFVIKGEMSILMTAMRRGSRWSSHSHQDDDQEPLLKAFLDLKEVLNKIEDLKILDPLIFLGPFLEVIRSEDTTGPVTSLALSAVNKFISYGLIDPTHPTIPLTVHSIADAVTHARFVGTDQSSDGVVLMKIMQVLRTLTLSPEGIALTNESLCEIMLSCFKICFETRLNELLRKTSEHYLKDMVQLVFIRLPQFSEIPSGSFKQLKMSPGVMEDTRSTKRKSRGSYRNKNKSDVKTTLSLDVEATHNQIKTQQIQGSLSMSPNSSSGNIVDMQGSISQSEHVSDNYSIQDQRQNNNSLDSCTASLTSQKSFGEADQKSIETSAESKSTLNQENLKGYELKDQEIYTMNWKISALDEESTLEGSKQFSCRNEEEKQKEDEGNQIENERKQMEDERKQMKNEGKKNEVQKENKGSPNQNIENPNQIQKITQDLPQDTKQTNQEYINPRGIRFMPQTQEDLMLIPYGLACVRELLRFLISLCNPIDKQNTEVMIHLGLSLLQVVFEVGADNIGKYTSLLALVKDELCRNLFSLLTHERITVFAADLQVSFLMFESLRTHLKFQLELYLTKLMEIIMNDTGKISFDHKEMALDNILQLWRIPGFVTELYLNYDCDLYCSNLYEELTKLLAKNSFPSNIGVYPVHLLSLDALLTVIESIEVHCRNDQNDLNLCVEKIRSGVSLRQKFSDVVPTREEILIIKNKKKWLPTGTEYFNQKPKKGIQFLQEHGLLKMDFDPQEVVLFLRENPALDKKMIGEYISGRNNLQVLEAFVKMFDFTDMRIDEALRMYLETFRLPGEAPLISLVMEHFADHWHKCNGEPFAHADAAFTLAYAIIMLNVDQHNHNVKKQNNPMTAEEFKKNLKKVNGGDDFDQDMLDEIYNAIKNEEIVMPAEQTGLVRENYLWKVLLRRGASKDGIYIHVSSRTFDSDLFALIWGPTVAALSSIFDKSEDPTVYKKAIRGFERCAFISSHFQMTQNLDMLVLTLSKFTALHNLPKQNYLTAQFGSNIKAQLAMKTVFALIHQHGDNVREGWKNIFDLILTLYSLNLLPKSYTEVEDFIEPSGKITLVYENVQMQKQESGLLSSLYSYMLSSENLSKVPTQEEQEYIDIATCCINECNIDQVVTDSKFLHEDALLEMIKTLVDLSRGPDVQKSLGYSYNENVTVFFLELLVRIVIQNRDRVMKIWPTVRDHLYTLVMNASYCDYQFLLERSVIGLLRLAIRLMRNEDMSPIVLQSLRMLLLLKSTTLFRISRQISFGLYELLKTSAQNIHTNTDWSIIFTLLECVGAGAQSPKPITDESQTDQGAKSEGEGPVSSEEDSPSTDRGYTSDSELTKSPRHTPASRSQSPNVSTHPSASHSAGGWIIVGNEGEIQPVVGRTPPPNQYSLALNRNLGPHDPSALVKCCDSLAFLVRDVAHITPYNFDNCVHCIRTFVEASLHEGKKTRRISGRDGKGRKKVVSRKREVLNRKNTGSSADEDGSEDDDLPNGYHQVTIQLLDLMHTLHTRTAQIFKWWAEEGGEITKGVSLWTQGWCPLLQGIARLCCDVRKQVRMTAITYLQRALLVHDLHTLTGPEWEACFQRVLFPLLAHLLQPLPIRDPHSMEETRNRAATVFSKVFLHHLTPLLSLPTFSNLWLTILDFMDKYMHAENSDLLLEAIPESLKNMLLVMDSGKVFDGPDGRSPLWDLTWERIGKFLPNLKEQLFKEEEAIDKNPDEFPKSTIVVTKHNVENATRSSIILQPPSSQKNINSPLFAHLGQMVSTPIGIPTSENTNLTHNQTNFSTLIKPPAPISIPLISIATGTYTQQLNQISSTGIGSPNSIYNLKSDANQDLSSFQYSNNDLPLSNDQHSSIDRISSIDRVSNIDQFSSNDQVSNIDQRSGVDQLSSIYRSSCTKQSFNLNLPSNQITNTQNILNTNEALNTNQSLIKVQSLNPIKTSNTIEFKGVNECYNIEQSSRSVPSSDNYSGLARHSDTDNYSDLIQHTYTGHLHSGQFLNSNHHLCTGQYLGSNRYLNNNNQQSNTSQSPLLNYQPSSSYQLTSQNSNQGQTFSGLYSGPQITTSPPTEVQPVSLYSEYMGNPYNVSDAEYSSNINENYVIGKKDNLFETVGLDKEGDGLNRNFNVGEIIESTNRNFERGKDFEIKSTNLETTSSSFESGKDFETNKNLETVNKNIEIADNNLESIDKNFERTGKHFLEKNYNFEGVESADNIFRSSNYFVMNATDDFIPPGSEILFGNNEIRDCFHLNEGGIPSSGKADVKTNVT